MPISKSQLLFKGIRMRSTWEVNIAKLMTFENINFIYEPRRYSVGKNISYLPDFYLPDYNSFVEVKGLLRTKDIRKMKKFVRLGYTLYLLRQQEYDSLINNKTTIKKFLRTTRHLIVV